MELTVTAEAMQERLAAILDPAWLAAQRWFRAKRRVVAAVVPHDLAPIDEHGGWLAVITAQYADGLEDRYLVPLVEHGHELREPRDGDGVWRSLAALMLSGGELAGSRGVFVFAPTAAGARLAPGGAAGLSGLAERRLGVEQSNSSVVLGDELIVKLYRLLEPGENPDVEVGSFLTEAGFEYTPAVGGSGAYLPDDDASCAVAMLQPFVASRGDGWSWALAGIEGDDDGLQVVEGITTIGAVTERMHAALASDPGNPAFPARAATAAERAGWRDGAERQLDGALAAVGEEANARLQVLAPAIRDRFAALESSGSASATRIHGDYHLGQLLRTPDGFMVIDFEGEPARPLSERRMPSSPLRDVAGMLRSLDYAVRTAQRAGGGPADADEWLARARSALLSAYGRLGPDDGELLAAFELEKACYEVRYEANNRPDWTWLPLDALERLAA
jgi:trehalose synthase-fused probable maltokinase